MLFIIFSEHFDIFIATTLSPADSESKTFFEVSEARVNTETLKVFLFKSQHG